MNVIPLKLEKKQQEVRPDITVMVDADSIIHQCAHPGRDIYGNTRPEYTEEEYEIAEMKVNERIISIFNEVELRYNIVQRYICLKGEGNFRYDLYPEYKANRKTHLPIIEHLCNWVETSFENVIRSNGAEADDYVYTLSKKIEHKGVICGVDKDLKQIPGLHYNYNSEMWDEVTELEARHNFAIQMACGDGGDGVNFSHGVGPKKAGKFLSIGMSDYQYIKALYKIYHKLWGVKTKETMRLVYSLLKLRDMS